MQITQRLQFKTKKHIFQINVGTEADGSHTLKQ